MVDERLITAACIALGAWAGLVTTVLVLLWNGQRSMRVAHQRLINGLRSVQLAHEDYSQACESALGHLRDSLQTLTTVSANLDMRLHALSLRSVRRIQAHSAPRERYRDIEAAIDLARAGREPASVAGAALLSDAESDLVCAVHRSQEDQQRRPQSA